MSASSVGMCKHGTPKHLCYTCGQGSPNVVAIVESLVRKTRFRFSREKDLQDGLQRLFETRDLVFRREVDLGEFGTIDFLMEGGLGVEVKTDGGLSLVTRQLHRYSQSPDIVKLMLVTSKTQHDHMPCFMNGKDLYVVPLIGSAF